MHCRGLSKRALGTGLLVLVLLSRAAAAEVTLAVEEPTGVARKAWPVTSSIPLAAGALTDVREAALFTAAGQEIPLQTEALCRWPDGSVRWLLLDFLLDLAEREKRLLVLRYGPGVQRAAVTNPVVVAAEDQSATIRTGPLQVKLSAERFRLLDAVWLDCNGDGRFTDEERLTQANGAGIFLQTPDGRTFAADQAKVELAVEEAGPIRACVRITGRHAAPDGSRFRFVLRLHAYRGQPYLRMDYTFVNDYTDELMTKIDSLEMVFACRQSAHQHYVLDGQASGPARVFQIDDRAYSIADRTVAGHATGWAAQGDGTAGVAVGVRHCWKMWPKSFEHRPGALRVGLCPHFKKGLYDGKPWEEESKLYCYLRGGSYTFKVGVARTHELWTVCFAGAPDARHLDSFFRAAETPLLAQCAPAYTSATQALGPLPPADRQKYAGYDAWIQALFDEHLADRERVREYGLLNFGDWYNTAWQSWGNLEYDTARIWFLQYLRTGDRRYFDRAEQAARYHVDVDVCHAVHPQVQAYGGSANMRPGQMWAHCIGHTGGYYGRYRNGRYEDLAPSKLPATYQIGFYDFGHVWIGGAFDHYLLTGDRRSHDIAVFASDTMAELCPTRYSDHIRNVSWPLHLLLDAYEATGKRTYLEAAGKQWATLKANLDPRRGWVVMLAYGHCSEPSEARRCRGNNMYMLGFTLTALARFHKITGDPEVLQALSVGIDQMIREAWSEEYKSFYLTSCRHAQNQPPAAYCSATFHAAAAFAYESALTDNAEHRRIMREALRTAIAAGVQSLAKHESQGQTGYYSGSFRFAPFGLSVLQHEPAPRPR
jgi:hypothetical protein